MDDDSLEEDSHTTTSPVRDTEHRRRNEQQAELLRKAYQRSRHAAYIREALRRAGREREADEGDGATGC